MHFSAEKLKLNRSALVERLMNKVIQQTLLLKLANSNTFPAKASPPTSRNLLTLHATPTRQIK